MSGIHPGEYETEPVPGLPEPLPVGEEILWQGSPSWRGLARRAFHTRKVALYFGLLLAWRLAAGRADGLSAAELAVSALVPLLLGLGVVGVLTGIAWLNGRATLYTITNRRIVMRFGVALTMAVNLPFSAIRSAGFREYADGTADIPLGASDADRIGYLMMWPHARPWKFGTACEPMLRAVPEGGEVAEILAGALRSDLEPALPTQAVRERAPRASAVPVTA